MRTDHVKASACYTLFFILQEHFSEHTQSFSVLDLRKLVQCNPNLYSHRREGINWTVTPMSTLNLDSFVPCWNSLGLGSYEQGSSFHFAGPWKMLGILTYVRGTKREQKWRM